MDFVNWTVHKMVVHEIFMRGEDRNIEPPVYATELTNLEREASNTFLNRVQLALSKGSQCVEMEIAKFDEGSFLHYAKKAFSHQNSDEFVNTTRNFADLLAQSQISRSIPGGILIIFYGTVGCQEHKYIGAIKAEAQDGFQKQRVNGVLTLSLLNELFLTPSSRMYKIGLFVENLPEESQRESVTHKFSTYVYDHLMSKNNRDSAAAYFYDAFLGCAFRKDAPRMTKLFFEYTRKFLLSLDIDDEKKFNLISDLQSYLRSTEQTFQVDVFATRYLKTPVDVDRYRNFMSSENFPLLAVTKDVKDIAKYLNQRKMVFRSEIKLIGPANKMDELVSIKSIDGTEDNNGLPAKWTQIIIKDTIKASE